MTVIGIHMIAWLIMFIADRENIPVIYRDNDSNNRVRYNFYLGHPNFFFSSCSMDNNDVCLFKI